MPLAFRDRPASSVHQVRLGLAANGRQFTLLVVINGFVGAMVTGYLIGALLAGAVADAFGLPAAIMTAGVLTFASGLLVGVRFDESRWSITPVPAR